MKLSTTVTVHRARRRGLCGGRGITEKSSGVMQAAHWHAECTHLLFSQQCIDRSPRWPLSCSSSTYVEEVLDFRMNEPIEH